MILITNSDNEYTSAMKALQVITSLINNRSTETVAPRFGDHYGQSTRTAWPKPEYL